MPDWTQDEPSRGAPADLGSGGEREWREGRGWRDKSDHDPQGPQVGAPAGGRAEPRAFAASPAEGAVRRPGDQAWPTYGAAAEVRRDPGGAERGDTASGQMARGSSDSGLGGYRSADVGGWGQANLNAQLGQGGYAPLNQGLDYAQDGGSRGPAGYDPSAYGPSARGGHHDPHEASYHHWRHTQLSSHDRDYARWREEQVRRYDEDYGSWRNERHAAFSREFEGWRAGRGGQVGAPASAGTGGSVPSAASTNPSERSVYGQAAAGETGFAHGANPTLARIADGQDGHRHKDRPGHDEDRQT